jgi:hypothetical protein
VFSSLTAVLSSKSCSVRPIPIFTLPLIVITAVSKSGGWVHEQRLRSDHRIPAEQLEHLKVRSRASRPMATRTRISESRQANASHSFTGGRNVDAKMTRNDCESRKDSKVRRREVESSGAAACCTCISESRRRQSLGEGNLPIPVESARQKLRVERSSSETKKGLTILINDEGGTQRS